MKTTIDNVMKIDIVQKQTSQRIYSLISQVSMFYFTLDCL